jgi:hypothetical protein
VEAQENILNLRGMKREEGEENCIMRSFIIVHSNKYYYNDLIKEDEMGTRGD